MTQTKTLYIDKLRGNCYEKKNASLNKVSVLRLVGQRNRAWIWSAWLYRDVNSPNSKQWRHIIQIFLVIRYDGLRL